ncbi:MAG: cyclic nucleotide-binding domain-containing protein [Elusimicrobia bacterium]|nr:cyclic nucleotide-binding domain-containing protein [Elusimicrobiota bacterium]
MDQEKLKLLKSLHLLDQIPENQLSTLERFLKPVVLKDGAVLFEEGSKGESLYFVQDGRVKISKKVAGAEFKDLAIMGRGDCFGEMAVIEAVTRSARACASGDTVVFELKRDDLNGWLKENPRLAMGFFAQLVQVQSQRLRRASNEIALLFDLSNMLLEPCPSGKELLAKVLSRVVPHLQGDWAAAAYLYNVFNDEMDFVASQGESDFNELASKLPRATETRSVWLDDSSYYVSLPGSNRPHGYLLFRAKGSLSEDARVELGRALTTVARLLTSALENINFRTEDALRARLSKTSRGYGSGI